MNEPTKVEVPHYVGGKDCASRLTNAPSTRLRRVLLLLLVLTGYPLLEGPLAFCMEKSVIGVEQINATGAFPA